MKDNLKAIGVQYISEFILLIVPTAPKSSKETWNEKKYVALINLIVDVFMRWFKFLLA